LSLIVVFRYASKRHHVFATGFNHLQSITVYFQLNRSVKVTHLCGMLYNIGTYHRDVYLFLMWSPFLIVMSWTRYKQTLL